MEAFCEDVIKSFEENKTKYTNAMGGFNAKVKRQIRVERRYDA